MTMICLWVFGRRRKHRANSYGLCLKNHMFDLLISQPAPKTLIEEDYIFYPPMKKQKAECFLWNAWNAKVVTGGCILMGFVSLGREPFGISSHAMGPNCLCVQIFDNTIKSVKAMCSHLNTALDGHRKNHIRQISISSHLCLHWQLRSKPLFCQCQISVHKEEERANSHFWKAYHCFVR